jgi:hypothetical protein
VRSSTTAERSSQEAARKESGEVRARDVAAEATKFRKTTRAAIVAWRSGMATSVSFGEYGLKALDRGR